MSCLLLSPDRSSWRGTSFYCLRLAPHAAPGRDLTEWMDGEATPDRAPHRACPYRARRAGLDYLALGDWHGAVEVDQRTHYCGTPEPDRFKHQRPGTALLVSIAAPLRIRDSASCKRRQADHHASNIAVALFSLVRHRERHHTWVAKVDLQLAARRRFEPNCRALLRLQLTAPLPDSKLYRTQTDDHSVLARQFLADHIRIALMTEEPFAKPIVRAIESTAPNRLLKRQRSTFTQISGDSVASAAKVFRARDGAVATIRHWLN